MAADFKQEKTNFLPGKQFEYALGNNMYNRSTQDFNKRHSDFSARYDDSTPIKCKTCFAAYPAVNLNASIMLCSHNTFTSTISYRLHFTNHKFHHHTSDDGTINPNFSR